MTALRSTQRSNDSRFLITDYPAISAVSTIFRVFGEFKDYLINPRVVLVVKVESML